MRLMVLGVEGPSETCQFESGVPDPKTELNTKIGSWALGTCCSMFSESLLGECIHLD